MDNSPNWLLGIFMGVILFTFCEFFLWLLKKCLRKQQKKEVANLKKYSTNNILVGERIYIDPKNSKGDVREGFTFFHPITGEEYFCREVKPVPPKSGGSSYVERTYSLTRKGRRIKVINTAYITGVPSYYFLNIGIR